MLHLSRPSRARTLSSPHMTVTGESPGPAPRGAAGSRAASPGPAPARVGAARRPVPIRARRARGVALGVPGARPGVLGRDAAPAPRAADAARARCLVAAHRGCASFLAAEAGRATALAGHPPRGRRRRPIAVAGRPPAARRPRPGGPPPARLRIARARGRPGPARRADGARLRRARGVPDRGSIEVRRRAVAAGRRRGDGPRGTRSPRPARRPRRPPRRQRPPPSPPRPPPRPCGRPRPSPATARYRVRAGDTLSGIAVRLGTTVKVLRRLNQLTDTSLIHPGQVLVVPKP